MTNLANYWNLNTEEQNQIKVNNPIKPVKTYRVTGSLNFQVGGYAIGCKVKQVVQAIGKYEAIERVVKTMVHIWFSSKHQQDLVECYGLNATWLNEGVLVETLMVSEGGDHWIEA